MLDPAPGRHRDAARLELLAAGDIAATIHAPVRMDALRHVLTEELSGAERAGPWVFSADWLAELEEDLRARIASADPIDPGVPVPARPWAADVLPLLPLERRGSRLYLPGSTPTLDGRAAEAEALAAELGEAGMRATKVDDESSLGSWRQVDGSYDSARATSSARTRSRSRGTSFSSSVRRRAASRWRASETSPARAPRRAAAARTARCGRASRAGSASAGCCGGTPPAHTERVVRLAIPILLAAVGVLAAPAAAVDVAPRALVLRSADVPAGWAPARKETGLRTNEDEAGTDTKSRALIARLGRVTGYQAEWRRGAMDSLVSRADVFRSTGGARMYLDIAVGWPPFVGDQGAPAKPGAHRRLGVRLPRRPQRHRGLGRLAVRRRRRNSGRLGHAAGHDACPRAKATASNRRASG